MDLVVKIGIIVMLVLLLILVVLIILGKRAEKKSAEQKAALEAASQTMSLFIIDKKKLPLREAGLPKAVVDQTPKYLRRAKLPILKVKVGPKVMSLICDDKIFPQILPKQEVKATVSGIYVTSAKRIRGPIYEPPKKKKLFSRREKSK